MEIIKSRKNCMGTMDFTLKIGRMKKAEEFITYPVKDDTNVVYLQSQHRWAQLNPKTGSIEMSARREQYANSCWFAVCEINGTIETDTATTEQLNYIRECIHLTAGDNVGNNILCVTCDNSGASNI